MQWLHGLRNVQKALLIYAFYKKWNKIFEVISNQEQRCFMLSQSQVACYAGGERFVVLQNTGDRGMGLGNLGVMARSAKLLRIFCLGFSARFSLL